MNTFVGCAFGVTVDTGIKINGKPVTENHNIYLDVDPCKIDETIAELENCYSNVIMVGDVDYVKAQCKLPEAKVIES